MSAKNTTPREWKNLLDEVHTLRVSAKRLLGKVSRRTDIRELQAEIEAVNESLSRIETGANIEYHSAKG